MIRSRRLRIVLLALSIFVVILAAGGFIWWERTNMTPMLSIASSPQMPSPNAYDQYLAAVGMMTDANKLRYAIDTTKRKSRTDPLDHLWSPAEKVALLRKNEAALRRMKSARSEAYLYAWAQQRFEEVPPFGVSEMLDLSELVVLEAQVKAEKRDWTGATHSCLDGIHFGVTVPRGTPVSIGVIGWRCRGLAEYELWRVMDHLSQAEVRDVAGRLERITADPVPLDDMLQVEKTCGQRMLLDLFRKTNWRSWILENACDFPTTRNNLELAVSLVVDEPHQAWRFMTSSKSGTLSEYSEGMDEWMRVASRPYAARFPLPKAPKNPFSGIMLSPGYEGMLFGDAKARAQDNLLLTALALRAYHLDHGHYPTRLTDLAPSYLTRVPADPFALKATLKYRKQGDCYVLYSIGPDGKDDGGRAILDPRSVRNPRYVDWNGKGDIVAGVNLP